MRSFIVFCLLAALVAFVGAQDPKGPVDEETGVYDFESHLGKLELNQSSVASNVKIHLKTFDGKINGIFHIFSSYILHAIEEAMKPGRLICVGPICNLECRATKRCGGGCKNLWGFIGQCHCDC